MASSPVVVTYAILYLLLLSVLIEIKKKETAYIDLASKKHLVTNEERHPNLKFIHNQVLVVLSESAALATALEENKINNWKLNDDIILALIDAVKESKLYQNYMEKSTSSFDDDKHFIIDLYTEVIAPSDRLYDYLEDYKLTWVDDLPGINTLIVKQIKQLKSEGFSVDAIEPMGAIYLTVQLEYAGKTTPDGTVLKTSADINFYLIKEAKIGLVPFSAFGNDSDVNWFRASVGGCSLADIEEMLPRLKSALQKLR